MQKVNQNLFPSKGRMHTLRGAYSDLKGGTISAKRCDDGYLLEMSALTRTDASTHASGELKLVSKATPNSPDLLGYLDKPDEGYGAQGRYKVAAWLKEIRNGQSAGQMYLSLSMEFEEFKPSLIGEYKLKEDRRFYVPNTSFGLSAGAPIKVTQVDEATHKVLVDFGDRLIDWFDDSIMTVFVPAH
jgi:hypothetical protein